ncbi:hypothetical protein [Christiangramia portivictoriae]|uniref:hypothetical protein n=1 Tax=Christiangramia portivictoriae TaxID=326069 RepID=UPI000479A094|nr:hypothetical protein [Christiangramia portivictoriae]
MKKTALFLILAFILQSCNTPSYMFSGLSQKAYSFPEGSYLLNVIDAPESVRMELREMVFDKLEDRIPNRKLVSIQNTPVTLINPRPGFNSSAEDLEQLASRVKGYDYFINIKAEKPADDLGSIQIGNIDPGEANVTKVSLEIINLNEKVSVYHSHVRSELKVPDDSKDFAFSVSAQSMMKNSLKKILKRMNN